MQQQPNDRRNFLKAGGTLVAAGLIPAGIATAATAALRFTDGSKG